MNKLNRSGLKIKRSGTSATITSNELVYDCILPPIFQITIQ